MEYESYSEICELDIDQICVNCDIFQCIIPEKHSIKLKTSKNVAQIMSKMEDERIICKCEGVYYSNYGEPIYENQALISQFKRQFVLKQNNSFLYQNQLKQLNQFSKEDYNECITLTLGHQFGASLNSEVTQQQIISAKLQQIQFQLQHMYIDSVQQLNVPKYITQKLLVENEDEINVIYFSAFSLKQFISKIKLQIDCLIVFEYSESIIELINLVNPKCIHFFHNFQFKSMISVYNRYNLDYQHLQKPTFSEQFKLEFQQCSKSGLTHSKLSEFDLHNSQGMQFLQNELNCQNQKLEQNDFQTEFSEVKKWFQVEKINFEATIKRNAFLTKLFHEKTKSKPKICFDFSQNKIIKDFDLQKVLQGDCVVCEQDKLENVLIELKSFSIIDNTPPVLSEGYKTFKPSFIYPLCSTSTLFINRVLTVFRLTIKSDYFPGLNDDFFEKYHLRVPLIKIPEQIIKNLQQKFESNVISLQKVVDSMRFQLLINKNYKRIVEIVAIDHLLINKELAGGVFGALQIGFKLETQSVKAAIQDLKEVKNLENLLEKGTSVKELNKLHIDLLSCSLAASLPNIGFQFEAQEIELGKFL